MLMENKFLPGPWAIEKSTIFGKEDQFGVAISSTQRTEFAFVYTRLSDEPDHSDVVDAPELMASAKLIAAAPDLLEALKEVRSRILEDEWGYKL
jgi:hypothetical protein